MGEYENVLVTFPNTTGQVQQAISDYVDIISDQLLQQLDIFFNCFLVQILYVFGIVGNIINIIVLSYNGLHDSNIMLLSLSITDLFGSIFRQVRRLKCLVAVVDITTSITVDTFGFVFFLLLNYWCLLLSIFLTTAIATERCQAVCAPFHVANIFTSRRIKTMLAFLCIYSTVIMGPLYYRLTFRWAMDTVLNATVAYMAFTKFYSDHMDAVNLFLTVFHSNICTTLPLLVILVCSLFIIFKLAQDRPRALAELSSTRTTARKKMKDRKAVKMLLFVCIATVFSCLPTAILAIYMVYFKSIFITGNLYYIFRSVEEVMYQFNASVNFIIYVSLSSKFNQTYRNLFRQYCCHFFFNESFHTAFFKRNIYDR